MKVLSVEYLGFVGKGKTVTEAKANAARQAQALIRDVEIGPKIVKLGSLYAVISRTKYCWQYQMIWEDGSVSCATGGFEDEGAKEMENRARVHAAQVLMTDDDPRLDLIVNQQDRESHQMYFNWQRTYRKAREEGFDDNDARLIAGGAKHLIRKEVPLEPANP